MLTRIRKYLFHRYVIVVVALLLIYVGNWLFRSSFVKIDEAQISENVLRYLEMTEQQQLEVIDKTKEVVRKNSNADLFYATSFIFDQYLSDQNTTLLLFKNRELVLWSDNLVNANYSDLVSPNSSPIIHLKNGWYSTHVDSSFSPYVFIAISRIKYEYPNHNRYLNNRFVKGIRLSPEAELTLNEQQSQIKIFNQKNEFLLGINLSQENSLSNSGLYTLGLVVFFGMLLMVWFLKEECKNLERYIGPFYATVLLVFSLCLLRYWTLVMEFPSVFYQFELFQPSLFAASFFLPSLGDFLINSFLLLYLFYFLDTRSRKFNYEKKDWSIWNIYLVTILLIVLFAYAWYIGKLLKGLIEDSNIEFNINNIFNLSVYSFVGFTIIGLLFFSFYLFSEFTLRIARNLGLSKRNMVLILVGISCLHIIVHQLIGIHDLLIVLWPLPILGVLYYAFYWREGRLSFNITVFLLLVFSLFSAHTLSKFTFAKEISNRLVLAEKKLATDEDPLIEIDYSEMESKLLKSELLNSVFDSSVEFSKLKFDEELEDQFFKGDWNNFELQFYLFSSDSLPIGLEGFAPVREFSELNNIILQHGIPTKFSPNLYFIYNSYNKLSYVIKLPVRLRDDDPKGFLFAELRSKKIPEDIGFPELLIDKSNTKVEFIHQYSYARYVDKVQVNRFGSYRYSLNSSGYEDFTGKYQFKYENGFNHLVYKVDDRTVLILSRPTEKFINKATTFSYLFTLFCLILIIGFTAKQISKGYASMYLSLQGKVQFLLVGVLLISLVLFGLGTRYFIADQYQEKNNNIISEKIQSVRIEVMHKLGREKELNDELKNYIGYILSKLSSVFLTDINLFDDKGKLIATSRPKIYQSGLLAYQMNPTAYLEMKQENKSEFIQQEQIGDMHYLSAYVPLLNDRNQILGYLNLPYFAKQSALETELSSFLVAILNIFVVLFALSILAALFVSNWITKPLRYVQQSLANMQLGKSNKPIEYTGKDEIGSLVEEYNKKVAELEKYAMELAKSERESAWREMAKQVAHEIKNPLTPMRLSIQHMQRSLKSDDPEWEQKLSKFSGTIIEQIDALTHIANEFSNFAKMPKAQEEVIDLMQILENLAELYRETPYVSIEFHPETDLQAFVYADKDQLLRVFTNLIKNAIQALPDESNGKVDIYIKQQAEHYLVEVKDNGSGIDPEKIDKIFMPNFTTKSTGMGLGLAMVKNIVENAGGKVWFETSQHVGTHFYVSLPKHKITNRD